MESPQLESRVIAEGSFARGDRSPMPNVNPYVNPEKRLTSANPCYRQTLSWTETRERPEHRGARSGQLNSPRLESRVTAEGRSTRRDQRARQTKGSENNTYANPEKRLKGNNTGRSHEEPSGQGITIPVCPPPRSEQIVEIQITSPHLYAPGCVYTNRVLVFETEVKAYLEDLHSREPHSRTEVYRLHNP